jgi:hypothetical protein
MGFQVKPVNLKTDDIRDSRCKRAWVAWLELGPKPVVLGWASLALSCASSSHAFSMGKIITPEKS